MDDRNPLPASPSLSTAVVGPRLQRHSTEEDGGDQRVACTGKSCQSCTAGAIADCVAVCCCPCAVVNFFVLAFFKLPWAVARKCLRERRKKSRRGMVEERKCSSRRDRDGIMEKGRADDGKREIGEEELSVNFSAEDIWLELYEVGHLGFGRVSFTGINFHKKGN